MFQEPRLKIFLIAVGYVVGAGRHNPDFNPVPVQLLYKTNHVWYGCAYFGRVELTVFGQGAI